MASAKEQDNSKSNKPSGAGKPPAVKAEPMDDVEGDVEVLEGNLKNIVEHGVSTLPSSHNCGCCCC